MNEIKIEFVADTDNILWQKYFDLCQEISRKYYKGGYKPDKTPEEFRESFRVNSHNLSVHEDYLVFEKGMPAAWFDISIIGNDLYFGFDVNADEVPNDILYAELSKLSESIQKYSCPEAVNFTFRESIADAFRNINAAVIEEMIISRIERENIDESFYDNIAANSELNNWKIVYYNEIPDSLLPQFIEFTCRIIEELTVLNPYSPKTYPFTMESWKENVERFGTCLSAYFLFDSDDKIAGLCWAYFYKSSSSTLSHNGGLTAVEPRYRGKGIAKFLKAKLYLKLLEENKDFKYITTDTMPWNKFMFRINEEFGFKPHRKGTSFKLTKDFLENYLNLK